jgi:hypothetical protein
VIGEHNHSVDDNISGHSIVRRPNDVEREHIRNLGKTGIPTKQILSSIREKFPDNKSSKKEVYRELQSAKKEMLNGMCSLEKLVEVISTDDYFYSLRLNGNTLSLEFFSPISTPLYWSSGSTQ